MKYEINYSFEVDERKIERAAKQVKEVGQAVKPAIRNMKRVLSGIVAIKTNINSTPAVR